MRWSFGLTNTTQTILVYLRIDVSKSKQKRLTSNEAQKKWLLSTHFYKLGTFCRLIVRWCFFCDLQRSEPVEWRNGKGDRVCRHFASTSVHLRQLRSSCSSRAGEDSSSRRLMRLVPFFTTEANNQTNNECLAKFVQTDNAPSSMKTAIVINHLWFRCAMTVYMLWIPDLRSSEVSVAPVSRGHGFRPRWSPDFFRLKLRS